MPRSRPAAQELDRRSDGAADKQGRSILTPVAYRMSLLHPLSGLLLALCVGFILCQGPLSSAVLVSDIPSSPAAGKVRVAAHSNVLPSSLGKSGTSGGAMRSRRAKNKMDLRVASVNPLSSLNQSIVDDLRQLLSALALRLDSALTVDRNNLDLSSQPTRNQLEDRIQDTVRERAILSRMQATMRELEGLPQTCANHFFSRLADDFLVLRPLSIATNSPLRVGHTMSFTFDHLALVSAQLSLPSANDIRIYYQRCLSEDPIEVHRIIEGIGTTESTLYFPIVQQLAGGMVHDNHYVLAFGNPSADTPLCNPRQCFLFYEDFTSESDFGRDWTVQRGEWTVRNGYLAGVSEGKDKKRAGGMNVEVDVFFNNGLEWTDVEVQMDIRVESTTMPLSPVVGPFLRADEPRLNKTTAAFAEYTGADGSTDFVFCSIQRDVIEEAQERTLPSPFRHNTWHRVRHVVLGKSVSHWFDGMPVEPRVTLDSMARSGTLGLGCRLTDSNPVCSARFDNIRVRSVVAQEPVLTLRLPCEAESEIKAILGTLPSVAADSCKQIYDLSIQDGLIASPNGNYFIKTPSGPVQTYCDMASGGWTLVAQISGTVGDVSRVLLTSNTNADQLQSPWISSNSVASLNAVRLAVSHASDVLLSSGNRAFGIGSRWTRWPLPLGRDGSTLWRRSIGAATVNAANLVPVDVVDWVGNKQTCMQNRFGVSPQHGAFPATVGDQSAVARSNDLCMAVGSVPQSSVSDSSGYRSPLAGFDAPVSDDDWVNSVVGREPSLSIWLR